MLRSLRNDNLFKLFMIRYTITTKTRYSIDEHEKSIAEKKLHVFLYFTLLKFIVELNYSNLLKTNEYRLFR